MEESYCPNCGENEATVKFYSVVLSFENWSEMLLLSGISFIFSGLMKFQSVEAFFFALLSIIPALFHFDQKTGCNSCGAEFRNSEQAESVRD